LAVSLAASQILSRTLTRRDNTARQNRTAPDDARACRRRAPPGSIWPRHPEYQPGHGTFHRLLNHFSEALMALEMVRGMPECIDDLRAWRPKTYIEHFDGSRLSHRGEVIRMYEAAPRPLREALDALAGVLNARLAEARDAAVHRRPADHAVAALRPLIAQLAALINGSMERSQAAIDAMFPG
jgi:hypothetical protein